jgi:hypothetical protein
MLAASFLFAALALAAPLEQRNNDGKDPKPSAIYSGLDPVGNTTLGVPVYRALSDFDYQSINLGLCELLTTAGLCY